MIASADEGADQRALRAARRPARILAAVAAVLLILLAFLSYTLAQILSSDGRLIGLSPIAGVQPVMIIEGPGAGQYPFFESPMGVAVGKGNRIYVADAGNDRVCAFGTNGRFLFEFGGTGVDKPLPGGVRSWVPGRLNFPVGIDADKQGNLYVADFRNDCIRVFDADGVYLRSFPDNKRTVGRGGSGQDGTGIAVTDVSVVEDRVYATDRYQVLVFSLEGELLGQYGRPGRGELEFDHPNGIAATPSGQTFVSDSNNARIVCLGGDARQLWSVGSTPPGPDPRADAGPFGLPRGLAVLSSGTVVVADAFNFGIMTISPDGSQVKTFGVRGSEPGTFDFPNDVDAMGDTLVVADKGNNRVQLVKLVR